ncbi:hypothetical protein NQ317_000871 [Molorchus minor]|uniref:Uncharacterized protein n=1 Tax=Molorchus minor TaxID=1323400 RepID=A0ABQ9JUA1_9CUCU|nr:hypothetical protein NQ317_000871 [Molorchus minor]
MFQWRGPSHNRDHRLDSRKSSYRGPTHTVEITSGVTGGIFLIILIISLVLYRNWRYEQELDSLLWKVDYKDIIISEESNCNNQGTKVTRSIHPLIRTSQVSLSSNPDADFRYSTIFTQIGIYKGRVFAIKKVHRSPST